MADCGTFTPSSTVKATILNELKEPYVNANKRPDVKYNVAEDPTLNADRHVPTAVLQAKYAALQAAGHISAPLASGLVRADTVEAGIVKDRAFVVALHAEFCFYYTRWVYALDQWISAVTGGSTQSSTDTSNMLDALNTLNKRCIFLIEFANYAAQQRIPRAQEDATSIATLNATLNTKLDSLRIANAKFDNDKATVITQQEMVRYTASKNAETARSMMFWGIGNVLALGAIGYMYAAM
jgi:hypothetical protein